jgi:hypothetical protein
MPHKSKFSFLQWVNLIGPLQKTKFNLWRLPKHRTFYGAPPPLASYIGEKGGRTLGKTYGIKARRFWEHPCATHWEPTEHIENLIGTRWELERNMSGTGKTNKNQGTSSACWAFPSGLGSCRYIALKVWTIILTIDQHCHFLIFGFEMDARENGEEDPCMKFLLKEKKSWEMIAPFWKKSNYYQNMGYTISLYEIREIQFI